MKTASALLLVAGMALGGCTYSEVNISPDFGQAVRQDAKAQIADPDATYDGVPAPGSNGARVGLAQHRYERNQVIQPSTVTASSKSTGADNGSQGGGGKDSGAAPASGP